MRILIDLQGCQSNGSRQRGIGRYSMALARTMARVAPHHEFWLLLNGAFADTIPTITSAFDGLIPAARVVVFQAPAGCAELAPTAGWRTRAAELVREHAIQRIAPDVLHISSLFEGLGDDCVTSVGRLEGGPAVAVTLFDLIPLLNSERYLGNATVRAWYEGKLASLSSADLLLGISESACDEARGHLPAGQRLIVNISSAADPQFLPGPYDPEALRRLGLARPFIMYTGGIDWRKNLEGLIRAYASLPAGIRSGHQLALVCHAEPAAREALLQLAGKSGLGPDELVLTGFVSDTDLVSLYRACKLFVFPSLHEGFGLPALEAMLCGAPVIGSGVSSIPEVIGRNDAMFDPTSDEAIAQLMARALEDPSFLASLRTHGATQARKFSWEASALSALEAIESLHAGRAPPQVDALMPAGSDEELPALAVVTPLPPLQSGISDYCSELLPALSRHYRVVAICDAPHACVPGHPEIPVHGTPWLHDHAGEFARILYHFGNSQFHAHMLDLLRLRPGVVVLHDFFLSGMLNWQEVHHPGSEAFMKALFASHGGKALDFERTAGRMAAMDKYPCNRTVLDRATGVIVHSEHSRALGAQWYGDGFGRQWRHIPHLRVMPPAKSRELARARLGLGADDFVVCSFGHVGPTKLNARLLEAWQASPLAENPKCRLAFVGKNALTPYGEGVQASIDGSRIPGQISITGYVDREMFETWLLAADVAVQLRAHSRGETSGAVLDCLAHGLPVVVNANGAMAEYPESVMLRLADQFRDAELLAAIEQLRSSSDLRSKLAQAGRAWVEEQHDPAAVALLYRDAMEHFTAQPAGRSYWKLIDAMAGLPGGQTEDDLRLLATAAAGTLRALDRIPG